MEHKIPRLVKAISILHYIGAAFFVVAGIALIAGSATLGNLITDLVGQFGTTLFAVLGVFLLLLGAISFFAARGLWKGQNWARILVIVLSIISLLWSVVSLADGKSLSSDIIGIIINGAIAGYLMFNKHVKHAFSK